MHTGMTFAGVEGGGVKRTEPIFDADTGIPFQNDSKDDTFWTYSEKKSGRPVHDR